MQKSNQPNSTFRKPKNCRNRRNSHEILLNHPLYKLGLCTRPIGMPNIMINVVRLFLVLILFAEVLKVRWMFLSNRTMLYSRIFVSVLRKSVFQPCWFGQMQYPNSVDAEKSIADSDRQLWKGSGHCSLYRLPTFHNFYILIFLRECLYSSIFCRLFVLLLLLSLLLLLLLSSLLLLLLMIHFSLTYNK